MSKLSSLRESNPSSHEQQHPIHQEHEKDKNHHTVYEAYNSIGLGAEQEILKAVEKERERNSETYESDPEPEILKAVKKEHGRNSETYESELSIPSHKSNKKKKSTYQDQSKSKSRDKPKDTDKSKSKSKNQSKSQSQKGESTKKKQTN